MIVEKEYFNKEVNIYLDKIISKKDSNNESLVNKIINKQKFNFNNDQSDTFFKSYLKKDESNCFTIVDIKNSIKCLFKDNYLSEYFSQFPSYISLNNFDGTLIYVKKSYYDILFNKEGEEKINSRVIIIIEDFDLDQAQKMSNELYNQKYLDINLNPDIEDKIEDIYYSIIREKTDIDKFAQNNINEHLKIDVEIFNDKNFGGINKNIISSEINISPKEKIAWFLSGTSINNFKELSNEEEIMNIHEILIQNSILKDNLGEESNEIKGRDAYENIIDYNIVSKGGKNIYNNKLLGLNNINLERKNKINSNNKITVEKLKNLGHKSISYNNYNKNKNFELLNKKRDKENELKHYKNSSYNSKEKNNLEKIGSDINILFNDNYNSNAKMYKELICGDNIEQNNKFINSLPIEIQNLITKVKQKEPITYSVFEKYKAYKKLNANDYKKEKLNK